MSTTANPHIDVKVLEETRRHIGRLLDELGRLSEADLSSPEYYNEVLQRVCTAMAAPAAAVYVRNPHGNPQLAFQLNLREVGLTEENHKSHEEVLHQVLQNAQPMHLMPHSGGGPGENGRAAPGNPTDLILLLVPIILNSEAIGLLEVWQSKERPRNAIPGFLQFMGTVADLMSRYQRNQRMGEMAGQQQTWTQLEAFARQVHSSLNTTEIAYLVANEGRRLIDCDRVSVGLRMGRKTRVEAVSGSDTVEKRSNLVKLMRKLFDAVLKWGEKLVYAGTKDDSLPPDVNKALDAYLAESNSKVLVLLPMRDEREKESKKPPRSAMLLECFETTTESQQLVARLEAVGKHAVSALYNAVEYRRIPFRWVWLPMAKVQEGLGGKARAIMAGIFLLLVALGSVLYLVPYPLKMDAKGNLLPITRYYVFAPESGKIIDITPRPKDNFPEGANIIELQNTETAASLRKLDAKLIADRRLVNLARGEAIRGDAKFEQKKQLVDALAQLEGDEAERDSLLHGLIPNHAVPGNFFIRAPAFTVEENTRRDRYRLAQGLDRSKRGQWTMLSTDQRENLKGKRVDSSVPLMRIGDKESGFEVELKIPQKHYYQVENAFSRLETDTLDVDLKVRSEPTRTFKGKLLRRRIGGEATPQKDEQNEPEPVVIAYVELDHKDIAPDDRVPKDFRTTGIEVLAKIRCGDARMGYSLFYGVWEFICEKILFSF